MYGSKHEKGGRSGGGGQSDLPAITPAGATSQLHCLPFTLPLLHSPHAILEFSNNLK